MKTADLQAHNAALCAPRCDLVGRLFSLLLKHLFSNYWNFSDSFNEITSENHCIYSSFIQENLSFFGGMYFENVLKQNQGTHRKCPVPTHCLRTSALESSKEMIKPWPIDDVTGRQVVSLTVHSSPPLSTQTRCHLRTRIKRKYCARRV